MKGILSQDVFEQMFKAISNGEVFTHKDANTEISVGPNGISIQYQSTPVTNSKEEEVNAFFDYCNNLDDDFFIEVCESFADGELEFLQNQLDTNDYKKTIDIFTSRIKEISNTKLAEISNAYDAEIKIQEHKIKSAKKRIAEIHNELDEATRKYTC